MADLFEILIKESKEQNETVKLASAVRQAYAEAESRFGAFIRMGSVDARLSSLEDDLREVTDHFASQLGVDADAVFAEVSEIFKEADIVDPDSAIGGSDENTKYKNTTDVDYGKADAHEEQDFPVGGLDEHHNRADGEVEQPPYAKDHDGAGPDLGSHHSEQDVTKQSGIEESNKELADALRHVRSVFRSGDYEAMTTNPEVGKILAQIESLAEEAFLLEDEYSGDYENTPEAVDPLRTDPESGRYYAKQAVSKAQVEEAEEQIRKALSSGDPKSIESHLTLLVTAAMQAAQLSGIAKVAEQGGMWGAEHGMREGEYDPETGLYNGVPDFVLAEAAPALILAAKRADEERFPSVAQGYRDVLQWIEDTRVKAGMRKQFENPEDHVTENTGLSEELRQQQPGGVLSKKEAMGPLGLTEDEELDPDMLLEEEEEEDPLKGQLDPGMGGAINASTKWGYGDFGSDEELAQQDREEANHRAEMSDLLYELSPQSEEQARAFLMQQFPDSSQYDDGEAIWDVAADYFRTMGAEEQRAEQSYMI